MYIIFNFFFDIFIKLKYFILKMLFDHDLFLYLIIFTIIFIILIIISIIISFIILINYLTIIFEITLNSLLIM